jgi:hypothetical protein
VNESVELSVVFKPDVMVEVDISVEFVSNSSLSEVVFISPDMLVDISLVIESVKLVIIVGLILVFSVPVVRLDELPLVNESVELSVVFKPDVIVEVDISVELVSNSSLSEVVFISPDMLVDIPLVIESVELVIIVGLLLVFSVPLVRLDELPLVNELVELSVVFKPDVIVEVDISVEFVSNSSLSEVVFISPDMLVDIPLVIESVEPVIIVGLLLVFSVPLV